MARSVNYADKQLKRLRRLCAALPETTEKLSHGEPTFFVRKKVFAMFSNNHHNDGHIAVWLPAPPGIQAMLIEGAPDKFFRPPYVGVRGWIGVELDRVSDEELDFHLREAWRLVAPKRLEMGAANRKPITKPSTSSPRISRAVVARRRSKVVAVVGSLPGATVSPCGGQHLSLEVGGKRFGYYLDSHHGNGRVALNCKAEPGANQALAGFAPDLFHIPAYVGSRGWVGLWIDLPSIDWDQVRSLLVDAYRLTAPKRLVAQLDSPVRGSAAVKGKSARK
jgi:hypothetical protein